MEEGMTIHWSTMEYEILGAESLIWYIVRHDADTVLVFSAIVQPPDVDVIYSAIRGDFFDGSCTILRVFCATSTDV